MSEQCTNVRRYRGQSLTCSPSSVLGVERRVPSAVCAARFAGTFAPGATASDAPARTHAQHTLNRWCITKQGYLRLHRGITHHLKVLWRPSLKGVGGRGRLGRFCPLRGTHRQATP
eukprot:6180843-Pleurochrysis_carterae.AAC.2